MPLEILGPMVVLGILGIAVMLHLGGHSRVAPLSGERVAREWLAQYPHARDMKIEISDDNRVALVQSSAGVGLMWTMGADTAARVLAAPARVSASRDGLDVRTGDFTAPRVRIALANPDARDHWTTLLTHPQDKDPKA